MLNRPQIKSEARVLIRTAAVSPILVTAVMQLVVFLLDRVSDLVEYGSLFYSYAASQEYLDALLSGDPDALTDYMSNYMSNLPSTAFFSILVGLFTVVLQGGYFIYCMGIRQGRRMPCSSLLDGLSVSGRLILCRILIYIKTLLWSMLFVIPGMIAVYRYRFAYYNLLTDPTLSVSEAIQLSCRQTSGMKWSLFVLDFSFIGWYLLSTVLSNLLSWIVLPLAWLVSLAFELWLTPYRTFSDLAYFEEGQRRQGRAPYGGYTPPDGYWGN